MKMNVYNLFKEEPPKHLKNKQDGYVLLGKNDKEALLLSSVLNQSPTARACIDTFIDYTQGRITVGDVSCGYEEKFKTLHNKVATDLVEFGGVYIHLMYNFKGEATKVKHLPYEQCRLGIPDDLGYVSKVFFNPQFATEDYNKKNTIIYDIYNPNTEVIQSQIKRDGAKYGGQVYFYGVERSLSRFYPKPYYHAAVNWLTIDGKISLFHERNIDNNFLLSVALSMVGDPDEAYEKDNEGNVVETVGEHFDRVMRSEFAGAKNGGKVMVFWSELKDNFPQLQAFPNNTNHDLFNTLQELTTEQICVGTRVPPILAGVQVTGKLGATTEIENAIDLLNSKVYNFQQILEDIYAQVFSTSIFASLKSVKIAKLNPFNILPDWAVDVMSQEEKRKYLKSNYNVELDELPSPTNNPV